MVRTPGSWPHTLWRDPALDLGGACWVAAAVPAERVPTPTRMEAAPELCRWGAAALMGVVTAMGVGEGAQPVAQTVGVPSGAALPLRAAGRHSLTPKRAGAWGCLRLLPSPRTGNGAPPSEAAFLQGNNPPPPQPAFESSLFLQASAVYTQLPLSSERERGQPPQPHFSGA